MRLSPRPPWTDSWDLEDSVALRGLLHDLGHGLATLSCLVQTVRLDQNLTRDTDHTVELTAHEIDRLLYLIRTAAPGGHRLELVSVRRLIRQIVELAAAAGETVVTLLPGHEVELWVDPTMLWRAVSNLVGNAVRAAGPGGRVAVSVARNRGVGIEVTDNGPGFGLGPPGSASLGLEMVAQFVRACAGTMTVHEVQPHGTRIQLVLPGQHPGTRSRHD